MNQEKIEIAQVKIVKPRRSQSESDRTSVGSIISDTEKKKDFATNYLIQSPDEWSNKENEDESEEAFENEEFRPSVSYSVSVKPDEEKISKSHSQDSISILNDDVRKRWRSEDLGKNNEPSAENALRRPTEYHNFSLNTIKQSLSDLRLAASGIYDRIWHYHDELPAWRRDNSFIVARHRPCTYSIVECFKSVFSWHNETMNIWTHLLGFLGVVAYIIHRNLSESDKIYVSHDEERILLAHEICSALCLLFSCVFHILECHSPEIHSIFCRLDHVGIALLIWSSKMALIQTTSIGRDPGYNLQLQAWGSVTAMASVLLQASGLFSSPAARALRTLWFISTSTVWVAIPVHDLVSRLGLDVALNVAKLDIYFASLFSITTGAIIYVSRIPERFAPGYCDLYLQGHNILHICVVITIALQLYGLQLGVESRAKFAVDSGLRFSGMPGYVGYD